jgi:hypothetical protein
MISRRIGGPSAITWPAFWACVAVSVAGNLPDRFSDRSGAGLPLNVLAATLSVVAMFAVMLALRPVLLRDTDVNPHPRRVLVVFIIGAATRGVTLGLLLGVMGTGEPRLAFRMIASIITLPLVMIITEVVVDLARTGTARRSQLRAEADQLRRAQDDALAQAADIQERATTQVRGLLLDRLAALRDGRVDDLAPGLRADAEQVIRPMSHEMVALAPPAPRATSESGGGRISWGDVWHAASLGQPFRPALAAVLLMVMGLSMLSAYNDSVVRGLMYAVIGGLLIVVVLGLLGRLVSPRLREMELGARTTVLILSTVVGLAAVAVSWALLMNAAGSEHPWRVPVALIIVGPVLVLALAAEQGFHQQVDTANAELMATNARLQYSAAVAGAAAWHEERRMSRALHGPVQTAVRTAAMRIDEGDLAGAEHMLVDALGRLEPDQHQTGVRDALVGVARAWDGLCAVEVDMPDGLAARIDESPPLASSVVDICTDACSNAVRHGGATSVAMRAVPMGDMLELVVSDDGAPNAAAGLPGLGSAMLDDVSITWLRRREDGRTVLRATLPLVPLRATAA